MNDLFILAEKIAKMQSDKITRLERRRKSHFIFLLLAIVPLTVVLTPFVTGGFLYVLKTMPPLWLSPLLSFIGVTAFAFTALDSGYRHKAKHDFLYLMANALDLQYRRGGFITLGDLYDHHVLPPYAQSHSEEGFSGRESGINFQFQDFHVMPVSRWHWFDYRSFLWGLGFYGVAIRIELGRHLDHHTILMPRFIANGALKNLLHEKFYEFEDIGLVYSKFKKRHTVLATDQVEARFILDPAMIERIMTLGTLLHANWLEVSFREREMVIIAGQTQNFFEVGHLFHPVNVLTIERCLLQMEQLKAIIKTLNLNPHAGLGRGAG